MSITIKQVALARLPLRTSKPTLYSSDRQIIGGSYEVRALKPKDCDKKQLSMVRLGKFDVEPINFLKQTEKIELPKQLVRKEASISILQNNLWGRHDYFSEMAVLDMVTASACNLSNNSTIALFSEPFPSAFGVEDVMDIFRRV